MQFAYPKLGFGNQVAENEIEREEAYRISGLMAMIACCIFLCLSRSWSIWIEQKCDQFELMKLTWIWIRWSWTLQELQTCNLQTNNVGWNPIFKNLDSQNDPGAARQGFLQIWDFANSSKMTNTWIGTCFEMITHIAMMHGHWTLKNGQCIMLYRIWYLIFHL